MNKITLILFLCFYFFLPSVQAAEKAVNLIWQINKEQYFETDWIQEILEDVNYKEIQDGDYGIVLDNAIVVVSLHENNRYQNYFAEFDKKKYKYGIIHIGDELYGNPTYCYKNAKFVLRNYWHKKFLTQKNVYTFPVGYKQGFWKEIPNKDDLIKNSRRRNYTWSFAGQITHKPTRAAMIEQMKTIPNHFIYETFAWADPNSLSTEDYRNLLLDTIFVPCPTGWWNLDSFRVCEALECGCIPIVEKKPFDYFARLFGDYPFLSVESWDQAPLLINKLLANPLLLEHRRKKCRLWWLNHKRHLKIKVAELCQKKL